MRMQSFGISLLTVSLMSVPAFAQIHPDLEIPQGAGRTVDAGGSAEAKPPDPFRPDARSAADRLIQLRLKDYVSRALHGRETEQIWALERIADAGLAGGPFAGDIRPLLDSPCVDVARAAAVALWAMGSAAAPQWLDAIQSNDGYTRRLALAVVADSRFALDDSKTKGVLPALKKSLNDPSPLLHRPAAAALLKLWPRSAQMLVDAIKAGDAPVKAMVFERVFDAPQAYLTETPWNKPDVRLMIELGQLLSPEIIAKAGSEKNDDRWAAMTMINALPPAAVGQSLVEMLQTQLKANDPSMRRDAARILSHMGPFADHALVEGAASQDLLVREICIYALAQRIDGESNPAAAAALMSAANDSDSAVRLPAWDWISGLQNRPAGLVERLAVGLNPAAKGYLSDVHERVIAARVLGRFAVQPELSVPALMHALRDDAVVDADTPGPRRAAIISLRAFGKEARPAFALLKQILEPPGQIADEAAQTLIVLGPEGKRVSVSYYVANLAKARDSEHRQATVLALKALGPDAAPAAAALTQILGGDDNALRIEVAGVLGGIGPDAKVALPALTRMMDNASPEIRDAAAGALVKICPDGKGLSAGLMAAVYNGDRPSADRLAAIISRGESPPALHEKLEDIIANDPNAAVRTAAKRAAQFLTADKTDDVTNDQGRGEGRKR